MAKVTIVFEDMPGDKVKVVANPTFEQMMNQMQGGDRLSSAQAYAIFALNKVREEGKRKEPTKIIVPRLK